MTLPALDGDTTSTLFALGFLALMAVAAVIRGSRGPAENIRDHHRWH